MSDERHDSNEAIIDFTGPDTPVPDSDERQEHHDRSEGRKGSARGPAPSPSINSPSATDSSQYPGIGYNVVSNMGAGAVSKWSPQTIYLRVMGRKPGPPNNELNLVKPYKAAPINYSIMGLFSKESSEERQIRHMLKTYKSTLVAELQHCSRASMRHKKRVSDQYAEFEVHEGKLVGWGLKFIIPFFRMQAWSRLSRSTLMRDLSLELEQVFMQRITKTSQYLQMFEESINRKNKYSIAGTEEFCMRPDQFLERDLSLITMTQQLHNLDEICSSTTKRFMQFESEYAWHGQAMRKKILLRILKRYKTIPQISELTNIEEDLSWSDFCLWYANRNKIVNQLELEFSDFVEDQREKEGRLFYRWHRSLFRAKEGYEMIPELLPGAPPLPGGGLGGAEEGGARRSARQVSISAINSFRLAGNRDRAASTGNANATTTAGAGGGGGGGDGGGGDEGAAAAAEGEAGADAAPAASASGKARGASADSIDGTPGAAASTGAAPTVAPAPGVTPPGGPSDGIIALKVTPFSIKAFIKYFANDIIGVQYGIPKDCMAANLALTEALFFRRIHAHIYQYNHYHVYANDQRWRQQCQMCRFVDPATYHVPSKYAGGQGLPPITSAPSSTRLVELSETVKILKEVKERSPPAFILEGHFDAEIRVGGGMGGVGADSAGAATPATVSREPATPAPAGAARAAAPASPHATDSTATASSGSTEKGSQSPVAQDEPQLSLIPPSHTPHAHEDGRGSSSPSPPPPGHTSATAAVQGSAEPSRTVSKDSPRLKMRLVSDDSTIYKTCFKEQVQSPPPPPPPSAQNKSKSLLKASFGGFTSPKTEGRKQSTLPGISEHNAVDQDQDSGNQVSSYTYGGEVPITYEPVDNSRMSISNLPEQFDGDEDTQVAVVDGAPSEAGDSEPASPTPRVHLNAGTVPGVRSVPVAHGSPDRGHHSSNASQSSHRTRKYHNSSSPRSYLTANALKANDRALAAPACTCAMCATFAASARLQRLPKYTEGQFGSAYARSSRVMSFLSTASTPVEIINILSLASKWLLRDAIDASGSRETIGADLLVPLFTMMLINAQLPNVHMILQVLLDYGEYNEQGDVSYTIANLEGSILFIMGLEIPADARERWELSSYAAANPAFTAAHRSGGGRAATQSRDITQKYNSSDKLSELLRSEGGGGGTGESEGGQDAGAAGAGGSGVDANLASLKNAGYSSGQLPAFTEMSFAAKARDEHTEDDVLAMKQLGEWLRDQNTMEDTITILQKEGWMA